METYPQYQRLSETRASSEGSANPLHGMVEQCACCTNMQILAKILSSML